MGRSRRAQGAWGRFICSVGKGGGSWECSVPSGGGRLGLDDTGASRRPAAMPFGGVATSELAGARGAHACGQGGRRDTKLGAHRPTWPKPGQFLAAASVRRHEKERVEGER